MLALGTECLHFGHLTTIFENALARGIDDRCVKQPLSVRNESIVRVIIAIRSGIASGSFHKHDASSVTREAVMKLASRLGGSLRMEVVRSGKLWHSTVREVR